MPRSILIVAVTLCAFLAAGVAMVGFVSHSIQQQQQQATLAAQHALRTGPLSVPAAAAPDASSPDCAAILAGLPRDLTVDGAQVPRRVLRQPAPPATVAWGDPRHDPVVVQCGLTPPTQLTPTSELLGVSGVNWLEVDKGQTTTWFAVDRPVYVALTLPANSGSGPLQELSSVLGSTLPARSVFPPHS
jgi:hypothetical protein